jgi:hypothetical protein
MSLPSNLQQKKVKHIFAPNGCVQRLTVRKKALRAMKLRLQDKLMDSLRDKRTETAAKAVSGANDLVWRAAVAKLFKKDLSNMARAYNNKRYQRFEDAAVQDFLQRAKISFGVDDRPFLVDEKVKTGCHHSVLSISVDLVKPALKAF